MTRRTLYSQQPMNIDNIDVSNFDDNDVVCIALQRTQHLLRLPVVGSPSFIAWLKFSPILLKIEAKLRRRTILKKTLVEICDESLIISKALAGKPVHSLVDIGCGHGIMDLYLVLEHQCHVHLVDIEESDDSHHGYAESGSGYASLDAAKPFLLANGVADASITLTNPKRTELDIKPESVDVFISLLSAGFHYPIQMYIDTIKAGLKPGGVLIFDGRHSTGQETSLKGFSDVRSIGEFEKHTRFMVTR